MQVQCRCNLFIRLFFSVLSLRVIKISVCCEGKVHLIWQGRGGWGYWNSKLEILAAPLTSSSIFQEPSPILLVLKYTDFRNPLLAQQFFQSPPFPVSKNFWSPSSISSFPLVILNELSPMIRRFTLVPRGKIWEIPMIFGKKGLKPTNITHFSLHCWR